MFLTIYIARILKLVYYTLPADLHKKANVQIHTRREEVISTLLHTHMYTFIVYNIHIGNTS